MNNRRKDIDFWTFSTKSLHWVTISSIKEKNMYNNPKINYSTTSHPYLETSGNAPLILQLKEGKEGIDVKITLVLLIYNPKHRL